MNIDHKFPKVNAKKCTGCGTCASVCPANVFEIKAGKSHAAKPEDCMECSACVMNCPAEAIVLVGQK